MSVLDLVAKISLDTTQYTAGLNSASAQATSFGGVVKKGLGTIGSLATKALGVASSAVVVFGGASIRTGKQFDVAMSQVAATMGKTSAEMEREVGSVDLAWGTFSGNLRDYAQEMGANTQFSAVQAAEALNYMALAGYNTQESMETLPKVMNLAAAGSMDLARASDMVTDAESAFGMESERTGLMVDEMAKAASTGNTSVEQLGEAFLRVGGLAKELNGGFVTLADGTKKPIDGITEMSIAMTAMANAGIKGSEAGTHMRNMIMKLSNPTKAGTERMAALGIKVFDAEGKMRSLHDIMGELNGSLEKLTQEEKIQAIADLFNARDLASVEAILAAAEQDWDEIGREIVKAQEAGVLYNGQLYSMEDAQAKFGDAIYDTEQGFKVLGAAEFMAMQQLDNLEGDMTYFKSALEGAQIAISDKITPALRDFVKEGTSGISEFTNKLRDGDIDGAINALGESIGNTVATAVAKLPQLVEVGGKLLVAIGRGIINNSPQIISSVETAIKCLAKKLPEIAQILVEKVKTIVGDLMEQAYNAIKEKNPQIASSLSSIGESFETIIGKMKDFWDEHGQEIYDKAVEIFDGIKTFVITAITLIVEGIDKFLQTAIALWDEFGTDIMGCLSAVKDFYVAVFQAISETISNFITWAKAFWAEYGDEITAATQVAWEIISTIIHTVLQVITGIVQTLTAIIQGDWQTAFETIQGITQTIWNAISSIFTTILGVIQKVVFSVLEAVRSKISSVFNSIKSTASSIWNNIMTIISNALSNVLTNVTNAMTNVRTTISNTWENAKKTVSDAVENIRSSIQEKFQAAYEKVSSIFGDIHDKIKDKMDAAKKLVTDAVDKIKEVFPISLGKIFKGVKLPHFKISGGEVPWGIGGMGTKPSVSIEWYKKAYQNPYLFTAPTVLSGIGFGDGAGAEMVYGHENLMKDIRSAMLEVAGHGSDIVQNITINSPTQLNPSEVARQTRNSTRSMLLRMRTT